VHAAVLTHTFSINCTSRELHGQFPLLGGQKLLVWQGKMSRSVGKRVQVKLSLFSKKKNFESLGRCRCTSARAVSQWSKYSGSEKKRSTTTDCSTANKQTKRARKKKVKKKPEETGGTHHMAATWALQV
jgi:hypothetical protein